MCTGFRRDVCFLLLINHSLSTNVVSFNFSEITLESDQGAVMVPAVWWQCRPEPPEASLKKEGKHI